MKRTGPPARKKPLARGKGLTSGGPPVRTTSLGRGNGPTRKTPPARTGRIRSQPPDPAEREARHDVVRQALARDKGCLAKADPLHSCAGTGLVGHELRKRSQKRDAHLDVDNVVIVCALANGLVEDFPDWGHALGLVARHGETIDDARARNARAAAGLVDWEGIRRPVHRPDGTIASSQTRST